MNKPEYHKRFFEKINVFFNGFHGSTNHIGNFIIGQREYPEFDVSAGEWF